MYHNLFAPRHRGCCSRLGLLTCICLMAGGLPVKVFADSKRVPLSRSLTEIKTFLSIKVIRHNAITQCASGNAWAGVSRSSIRFTYSSVGRHIGPCICHNSQTYTWNDVIPYKGRIIRVLTCLCLRAGGLLVKFPPTVDVITRMRNT